MQSASHQIPGDNASSKKTVATREQRAAFILAAIGYTVLFSWALSPDLGVYSAPLGCWLAAVCAFVIVICGTRLQRQIAGLAIVFAFVGVFYCHYRDRQWSLILQRIKEQEAAQTRASIWPETVLPTIKTVTNISRFGFYPSWSPDSRFLVFSGSPDSTHVEGGIWVFDRKTGTLKQVSQRGFFPAWSPKGDRIAFSSLECRLFVFEVSSGQIKDTGLIAGWGLQWSPDGRYLLSADSERVPADRLLLTDMSSWQQRELEFAKGGPYNEVSGFTWTPEGNVIVTAPWIIGKSGWHRNEIREYSLSGTFIQSIQFKDFKGSIFGLKVSSDNKFYVFGQGNRDLFVATRDGTQVKKLSAVGASPAWSPDGKLLAYDDSSSGYNISNGIFLADLH